MKKILMVIVLSTCMIFGLAFPVAASSEPVINSNINWNTQEKFFVPDDLAGMILGESVTRSRSSQSQNNNVVTAEQVMKYSIDLTEDVESKKESQRNFETGNYLVEYENGVFIITEGDIEIDITGGTPLTRATKPYTTTKNTSQTKTALINGSQLKIKLSVSYKYGYNGQLFFLQSNGAPKIENMTPRISANLGIASTKGGGMSPTLPLTTLTFSANPTYYYGGNRMTLPMSIIVRYGG